MHGFRLGYGQPSVTRARATLVSVPGRNLFWLIPKVKNRWSRRLYNDSVILIGLPDHITCGFLHETGSSYTLQYFDPAGKDGDRASVKKLRSAK